MTPGITKKIALLSKNVLTLKVKCICLRNMYKNIHRENLKWHQQDYLTCLRIIIFLFSLVRSLIRDH